MLGEILEIHFNWHANINETVPYDEWFVVGEKFEINSYDNKLGSVSALCEKIEISDKNGLHAIVYFDNGTVQAIWNLNKIIYKNNNHVGVEYLQAEEPFPNKRFNNHTEQSIN